MGSKLYGDQADAHKEALKYKSSGKAKAYEKTNAYKYHQH
jgi:hypothetical protein